MAGRIGLSALGAPIAVSVAILAGQLLLKSGMKRIGPIEFRPRAIFAAVPDLLRSPWIVGGLAISAAATLAWLIVLSRRDLSAVSPVMTGVYFVLLLLAARFLLGEVVTPARWFGAFLILVGVLLVGRSV
jgi:drug/metabolite transporter (DMT)-like permease